MDSPRIPLLYLLCKKREIAFRSSISDNRLRRIFKVNSFNGLEAIKSVLGENFLFADGWPRVDNNVASVFVGNLLIIGPSKLDAVNLALRWIWPCFCGNLEAEVEKSNVAFWAAGEVGKHFDGVDLSFFNELE
ncbi:hypothetical protein KI387_023641, partial [Taxus chinensis]